MDSADAPIRDFVTAAVFVTTVLVVNLVCWYRASTLAGRTRDPTTKQRRRQADQYARQQHRRGRMVEG